MNFLNKLVATYVSPFLKAHSAGATAALAMLISFKAGVNLTADQWYAVAGTYLGVGAVVHTVPNTPLAVVVPDVNVQDDGKDA